MAYGADSLVSACGFAFRNPTRALRDEDGWLHVPAGAVVLDPGTTGNVAVAR